MVGRFMSRSRARTRAALRRVAPTCSPHCPRSSLTPALVTAPFFVQVEALFFFLNWRPALHKRIRNLASQRIVAMNKAKREQGKKAN